MVSDKFSKHQKSSLSLAEKPSKNISDPNHNLKDKRVYSICFVDGNLAYTLTDFFDILLKLMKKKETAENSSISTFWC